MLTHTITILGGAGVIALALEAELWALGLFATSILLMTLGG